MKKASSFKHTNQSDSESEKDFDTSNILTNVDPGKSLFNKKISLQLNYSIIDKKVKKIDRERLVLRSYKSWDRNEDNTGSDNDEINALTYSTNNKYIEALKHNDNKTETVVQEDNDKVDDTKNIDKEKSETVQ